MTRTGVVIVVCLLPAFVLAQSLPRPRGTKVLGGLSFVGGVPTGSFGNVVDSAVGLDGQVSLTPRGEISSRTNYSETTFSWTAGGGVLLPLGPHGMVDLGVRYVGNGTVGWLAEGDVVEDADGQLRAYPRHTPANLVEITVGYTFGH